MNPWILAATGAGLCLVSYAFGYLRGMRAKEDEESLRQKIRSAQKFGQTAREEIRRAREQRERRSDQEFHALFL